MWLEKPKEEGGAGGVLCAPTGPPILPARTGHAEGKENPRVPHFHKLEFPIFDGKDDPMPWLKHYERFFHGQRTEENMWLASYHLTGSAQHWYLPLEDDEGAGVPP